MSPPDYCPHCGAEVPPKAHACPECGSDEQTGWSDQAHSDRLGLPAEEFNYDEFIKEEFGASRPNPIRPHGINWFWWVVAVLLLLALVRLLVF